MKIALFMDVLFGLVAFEKGGLFYPLRYWDGAQKQRSMRGFSIDWFFNI